MSTNKTSNYNLNQWVNSDRVLMEDFNEDNAKIDAALAVLNSGKAEKSALSSLQSVVNGKASASALSSLQSTVSSQNTALGLRNCQVYFTTRTGDGIQPPTFTFPHKPWLVIFFRSAYHGLVAVRGESKLYIIGGDSRSFNASYQFSGNSLTFTEGGSYVNGKNETQTILAFLEI